MPLYWLSFERDGHWRGAVVLAAENPGHACERAWRLGLNPAGEVEFTVFPDGVPTPPQEYCNRLLTRADVDELDKVLARAAH